MSLRGSGLLRQLVAALLWFAGVPFAFGDVVCEVTDWVAGVPGMWFGLSIAAVDCVS